jgi:hypothetical protein
MKAWDTSKIAVDPVRLAWLTTPNLNFQWGPRRSSALAGMGDTIGTVAAIDPEPISKGVLSIVDTIKNFFTGGNPTADKVVAVQNQITTQVLAPISADVSLPQVKADPTVISHSDWTMLYNALTTTQTNWLNFLHNTAWPDGGQAARQGEATLAPYFSGLLADIMQGLQATGGVTGIFSSIFGNTLPISPVTAASNVPGAPGSPVYGPPLPPGGISTAGFSTLVPVALAGLALWYFMGRKKVF